MPQGVGYGNTTDPQADNFLGYPGFQAPGQPQRGSGIMDQLNFLLNKLGRNASDGRSFFSPQFEMLSLFNERNQNHLDPTGGGQFPGNQGIIPQQTIGTSPWGEFQRAFGEPIRGATPFGGGDSAFKFKLENFRDRPGESN